MRLALHINDYSSLGPPARTAPALARVARTAEEAGFARLSLTDHVWQISMLGEQGEPMPEAYTTLGYLAGRTRSIELQTLVTAATYRPPGLLAKIVTTLDVLAGGPGEDAYVGEHHRLGSTLNAPQPVRRPRPGILIGGGGERTTLRLAARYADAFNVHGISTW
jgi:alkanesulfonate monooxygenase SsuD/methylene tetrahydromethanopterin reductase-like flavin-dependent oxidoreductase (luciferase family)